MENVLQFLITYNVQLIKGVIALVSFFIIIYVYRLFFIISDSGKSDAAVNTDGIEQKLNQIIENQKNRPVAETVEVSNSSQPIGDVDRLKLEVYTLRQQLSEAERKSSESNQSSATADPGLSAKHLEQIKSLESRLAEYEIIAEDIAELSQLRIENGKLKEQLAKSGGGAITPSAENEAVAASAASPPQPTDVAAATVASSPTDATETETETAIPTESPEELAIQQALAQAETEAALAAAAEAQKPAAAAEPVAAGKPLEAASAQDAADSLLAAIASEAEASAAEVNTGAVSEADQKLLDEFEQTIIKKG